MMSKEDDENKSWNLLRRRVYGTGDEDRQEQILQRFEKRLRQWEQATKGLFEAMPDGYKSVVREIDSAGQFFREKAAEQLEPVLNAELRSHPSGTFGEKNKLAAWINQDLSRLGLSLYSSKTQAPGMLAVEKTKDGCGRFRYNSRRLTAENSDDLRAYYHAVESFDELPQLKLIPGGLDRPQWDRWTEVVMRGRVKTLHSPGSSRSG